MTAKELGDICGGADHSLEDLRSTQPLKITLGPITEHFKQTRAADALSVLPGVAISLRSGHVSIVTNMPNAGELCPRLCPQVPYV